MNDIDPKIFKAYDIRGIYPDQLNETNIVHVIRAFYKFFHDSIGKDQPSIVLAYDMRTSGPQLYEAAKKVLVEMGANVIEVGQLSTPSFYFTVFNYKYDCGIQITASHNPKEWNGMKAVRYTPEGLIKIGKPTGMDDVQRLSLAGVDFTPTQPGIITPKDGILEDEVKKTLEMFGNPTLDQFKVVADPGNAMGAQYIEALFKQIPGNLVKMNFELDGTFPVHEANPLDFTTLVDLQKKVVEEQAAMGLATDGDGDRLYFIDEKGQVVNATSITSIVAREMLKSHPGDLIYFDIRDILSPKKIVEEYGGRSEIVRVGHAYITAAMNASHGIFAGESSGHMFFRDMGNAENNLPIIVCILKVLTEEKKTLSQLVQEVRRAHESGEFNFKVSNAPEILDALKEKYKDGQLETMDGVSISYPTWRFNVRTSNTEPLMRLNVEGYDQAEMEAKNTELKTFIQSLAKSE
jgi:phosphomannomutase